MPSKGGGCVEERGGLETWSMTQLPPPSAFLGPSVPVPMLCSILLSLLCCFFLFLFLYLFLPLCWLACVFPFHSFARNLSIPPLVHLSLAPSLSLQCWLTDDHRSVGCCALNEPEEVCCPLRSGTRSAFGGIGATQIQSPLLILSPL